MICDNQKHETVISLQYKIKVSGNQSPEFLKRFYFANSNYTSEYYNFFFEYSIKRDNRLILYEWNIEFARCLA